MESNGFDETPLPAESHTARRIKLVLGYLIAGGCLAWVLYNVHPGTFLRAVSNLNWTLVVLAIAVDNVNYVLQGIRWGLLLRPIAPARMSDTIQGIYVGVFGNEVLPLRFGELMRAYLLSRWYETGFSRMVPSMVLERLFEGIWLCVGVVVAVLVLPLPSSVRTSAHVFVNVIAVLLAAFLFAALRRRTGDRGSSRPAEAGQHGVFRKIGDFILIVDEGLREIGLSTNSVLAFVVTLASLLLQALALWLVAVAFGLHLTFWQASIVLVVIRVGSVVPNAPANIGPYQFFTALGVELFGVDRAAANGFALVLFMVLSGPLWAIGFAALSRTGETLFSLRREARDAAHLE